ncbi:hypothetical protein O6P37_27730 [Mycobacterium sp. CPCC 205372]|uniref:Uncharacterized protein n=1 Tax=Mycobacterium hippophais TaxID=3016340 RepID=A0ABT4Q1G4_9MYCO|nr:hypothetical protein [Mycobacterium hippophais]MCZ8382667.1 hypothetical protein [Mycobacterium hippophais]
MRLTEVVERLSATDFPAKDERAHPDRDTVARARADIETAVIDDRFLADCIARELESLIRPQPRRGLVPFLTVPRFGIRFAFGYWPPGGTPGPHEHNAWTITAVCRNELEVQTFDRSESYRRGRLVPKNMFAASAGRVGYIYEPSIHAPVNATSDWSLSLHVTSPRDGEPMEDCGLPVTGLKRPDRRRMPPAGHPYLSVAMDRARKARVHVLARVLAAMSVPEADPLLDKCVDLGSHSTRKLHTRRRGGDSDAPYVLRRTHPGVELSHRVHAGTVALVAETAGEPVEELTIDAVATEAIAFAARRQAFDARELPGPLTDEERITIAEALEDLGLFTMTTS